MKTDLLECNDMGSAFMLFKEYPRQINDVKILVKAMNRFKIEHEYIVKLRMGIRRQVYGEYEESLFKNSAEKLDGEKFLQKLYLFNGFSKMRGNGELPKDVLQNFDDEVVNNTQCDTSWPICLYDIFYKSKLLTH